MASRGPAFELDEEVEWDREYISRNGGDYIFKTLGEHPSSLQVVATRQTPSDKIGDVDHQQTVSVRNQDGATNNEMSGAWFKKKAV